MPDGWLDHPTTKRPAKQEAEDAWTDRSRHSRAVEYLIILSSIFAALAIRATSVPYLLLLSVLLPFLVCSCCRRSLVLIQGYVYRLDAVHLSGHVWSAGSIQTASLELTSHSKCFLSFG